MGGLVGDLDRFVGMGGEGLPHFGRQLKMGSIHPDIVPQSQQFPAR